MDDRLGACFVRSGSEYETRAEIERAGFPTRLPGYRATSMFHGKHRVRLHALFPGYVFAYLSAGWGDLEAVPGVQVLGKISPRDEARLADIELQSMLGDFNRVQYRAANGTFEKRRRRRKPRRSKRLYRATR